MNAKSLILFLPLLTAAAAQPPDAGGRPPHRPPPPPPVIHVLDADHDGSISAEEIRNSARALATLDMDGDGILSPRELHPHGPPPHADRPPSEN